MELYLDFGSKDGYDMFYNHKQYVKMIFNCCNSKKFYSLVKITQFKSQGNQPQREMAQQLGTVAAIQRNHLQIKAQRFQHIFFSSFLWYQAHMWLHKERHKAPTTHIK